MRLTKSKRTFLFYEAQLLVKTIGGPTHNQGRRWLRMYIKTHDRAARLTEEIHILVTMHGGVYPIPAVTALIEAELLQHAANTVVERAKAGRGAKRD